MHKTYARRCHINSSVSTSTTNQNTLTELKLSQQRHLSNAMLTDVGEKILDNQLCTQCEQITVSVKQAITRPIITALIQC